MSEAPCPHCGQSHHREVAFCPGTGRPVPGASRQPGLPLPDGSLPAAEPPSSAAAEGAAAAATSAADPSGDAAAAPSPASAPPSSAPPPTEKGVADLLREAYDMYRMHARALLTTCALLFVPASIVKSWAAAVMLAPTLHGEGGFLLSALAILGRLVTAFMLYGIIVPLTNGALTITVADRVLGGDAGWRQVWMLLFRRARLLLSALLPAAVLVAVGVVPFVIPGLVLGLLFAFVSPVVLVEGLGGRAALSRSIALVRSDWLRVALVLIVFGLVRGLAELLAGLLIPASALFAASLFGDLLTMVLLPIPVLGAVLLYFDIRRKHEGFTNDRLRDELAALRAA